MTSDTAKENVRTGRIEPPMGFLIEIGIAEILKILKINFNNEILTREEIEFLHLFFKVLANAREGP